MDVKHKAEERVLAVSEPGAATGARDIVAPVFTSRRQLQTVPLPSGTVRIAARRRLALVHENAYHKLLVDVRFERELGGAVMADDVSNFAADAHGSPAIRRAGEDVIGAAYSRMAGP